MLTVEFETEAKDGNIEIPKTYRRRLKGKLQVIISVKEADATDEPFDIISELIKNPLPVSDPQPLTRDEIYDRNQKFR